MPISSTNASSSSRARRAPSSGDPSPNPFFAAGNYRAVARLLLLNSSAVRRHSEATRQVTREGFCPSYSHSH